MPRPTPRCCPAARRPGYAALADLRVTFEGRSDTYRHTGVPDIDSAVIKAP
ncbi:hypothetical protein [Streptomyces sp. NPDC005336]|uniref:hypothetical protein n=1 Tax=unclassified Streptomyces TaxID=2593676 RepID=UPI0033A63EF3